MRNENTIRRKGILILLNLALIVSGLFSYPIPSYAERVVLSEQTYYHLDMGVQVTYQGSEWESRGYRYGDTETMSATIGFPQNIEVLDAYPLSSSKGSSFAFDGNTSSTNIPGTLKGDAGGSAANAYNQFYKDYVSTSMQASGMPFSSGNQVSFSYTVKLNTGAPLEAVELGKYGFDDEIWKLFGGKNNVQNAQVKAAIENALLQGRNGTANGNKLYLVFCPTVIEYKKYVTVGDLEADLDLPQMAKQGERFTVADASYVDSSLTLESAKIRYRVDGGAWQNLVTWPGRGKPGVNSGGTIDQQFDDICVVDYEILATTTTGQTSTKIKTISITDGREIDGKAILALPEYTYEGHPALAEDLSTFTVDGVNYSARRAYEEGVADNDFIPIPYSAGSASKKTLTTADVVFPKRGHYNVKLEVNTAIGGMLTDIKPIEVRKTPYIIDSLNGFQKENRKQILNISVATYPGKPIVDYSIKLRDMETGQEITLTKDAPQQNNATIKTGAVTSNGDPYWTNYELQFLTKNTSEQEYRYTIYMKDSKGDTDTVQKTFTVKPDLPPNPVIVIQDTFIRNKGTNIAEITTEDASTTDGDQLERTWSIEGENVKSMDGYKDLAFGTGQKVKFNKTGVGKTDVNLFLKDVWIEPTLEEYITDADRKTAEITKTTDVINIAPTVRLEPKFAKETEIVIVTDKKNKAEIGASINTLKAALIEKGFDPHISLAVAADQEKGPYRKVASWTYDVTVNCPICRNNGQMDSDYVYRLASPGKYIESYQERCLTDRPHVLEALSAGQTADSGYVAWSYPVNESRDFSLYLDDQEKYVYLACHDTNKTTVLNRDNGAYLTALPIAIPGKPFLSSDAQSIYFIDSGAIKKYDTASGTFSTVISRGGSLAQMMDGRLTFVGKKEPAVKLNKNGIGFYIGKFDMNTETIEEISIPELPDTSGVVSPMDMDSSGKVLLKQGNNIWVADTKEHTVKMTTSARARTTNDENYSESVVFVKDEKGEGVYAAHGYFSMYRSSGVKYFGEVSLYDFAGQNTLVGKTGWSQRYSYYNMNSISYAKLHSRENKIYILLGNQAQGNDWGGNVQGLLFRISLPSFSVDTAKQNWGWDDSDEVGSYAGSLMQTFSIDDRWMGMRSRVNLFRNSLTELDAKTFALRKHGNSGGSDSERYVIVAGDAAAAQILQNQEFQDEIELRGARSLFHDIQGSVTAIAEKIEEMGDSLKSFLSLEGDNYSNRASVNHDIQLHPNTEYAYEYKMTTSTGKAVDVFGVINPNSKGLENDGKYFEKMAAFINFNHGIPEPFFTMAGGSVFADGFSGYGYGTRAERNLTFPFSTSFTMEKEGYVSFDLFIGDAGDKSFVNTVTMYLNGALIGSDGVSGRNTKQTSKKIYLAPGSYTLRFDHYAQASVGGGYLCINNLKAVYYEDTAEGFTPVTVSNTKDKEQAVSGSFRVAGQEGMEVVKTQNKALTRKSGIEYGKYISNGSYYYEDIYERVISGYDKWGYPIYKYVLVGSEQRNISPFSFDEATGTYSLSLSYEKAYMYFNITAPADKFLVYSYNLSYAGGKTTDTSQPGERLSPGEEIRILRPGQTHTLSATMYYYDKVYDKIPKAYVSNIRIAEFDASDFGGAAALQSMVVNAKNGTIYTPNGANYLLAAMNPARDQVTLQHVADLPDTGTNMNNGISLSTSESMEKLSALISDFRLYKKMGGVRQLIFSQDFNSQKVLNLTGWKTGVSGEGKAEIVQAKAPAKEEDPPLVYKKGQIVLYNIFYDDYEKDPSQKQYWRYTHTPYNDGPHPQAAFVLDEDGNVISSTGAILSESIPRFYVDGKYTVEHWQKDNTNRTGDTSGKVDYSKYDKLSNAESLTFYIEGGASAPWITSIKTIPGTLKEGDQYRLQIGVDDLEKDELRLTTELYKDKKLIYTHKETGIKADASGNYPLTTTGYAPLAEGGKYEVVCTVRDWSGAGLGTYKFTVLSNGKITGYVNHTEQWNISRQKYNLGKTGNPELPRGYNVFWSGEKFMLRSEVAGSPNLVTSQILGYSYSTTMHSTGAKNVQNETIYAGEIWDKSMINKWGKSKPVTLTFRFTAYYSGGITKIHDVNVIVDNRDEYFKLHRYF